MAKTQQPELTQAQMLAMASAIKNAQDLVCPCGSDIFIQGVKLKKISRLLTGEEQDAIFPLSGGIFCLKCQTELKVEEEKPKDEGVISLDFRNKK